MVLLVVIHGYNLNNRVLNPNQLQLNNPTFTNFFEFYFANAVLRFRIPLLMTISGFLLAQSSVTSYVDLIVKKMRTLIVPFILIASTSLLFCFAIESIFYRSSDFGVWGTKIADYSLNDFVYRLLVSPLPFQLWYLKSVFTLTLLFPLIKIALKRFPYLLLVALFLLWAIAENDGGLRMIRFSFYFVLGVYIVQEKIDIDKAPKWFSTKQFLILFLLAGLFKTIIAFEGQALIGNSAVYIVRFLYDVTAVLGVILVWFGIDPLVHYCSNKKWYHFFAPKFFFIYAFHAPLITFMIDPYLRIFDFLPLKHLFTFLTLPIVVISICVGLDIFISKFFPSFYSLFTGGRGSAKKGSAKNSQPAINNHYQRVNDVLAKRYNLFAK
jgi:surface polysaccharide O-acyltransferase-like enzyme